MAADIHPFVEEVIGMAARDAHARMSTLMEEMSQDLVPISTALAAKAREIRDILKIGAEKDTDKDGFGLALSKRLESLHGRLLEEDAKWSQFRKEMEAAESRHNKRAVLAAKAKERKQDAPGSHRRDRASKRSSSFRDRDRDRSGRDRDHRGRPNRDQRPSRGNDREREGRRGRDRDTRSFLDGSSDSDGGRPDKELETLKRDLMKLVPKHKRPSSGCYACGDDHFFSEKCPKYEQTRKKVTMLRKAQHDD